ncbi:MAG: hypothetical protein ATN35_01065 [Epulopiscium sp. Nele67-Bin004]|nr:MAG: hypothetical protein ATN35_01065 [Epulopiscium sp. Nele67-Bin004]
MDYSSLDVGYGLLGQVLKLANCFIVTIVLLYIRKELKDVVQAKLRDGETDEAKAKMLTALLVTIGVVNIYAIFSLRDIIYTVQRLWS